ncbi:MAG: 2Fe-2S iron-sulfur cluster binding domain-containing protein, partial [Acidobacteria bacterium]|nr:2Fe-2S iron-sulfur cluster binding domain-containing protein [Acidobacteriota bacterium]
MTTQLSYTLNVNGIDYPVTADQGRNLLSVIRTEVGLTGTKEGCDDCECGACMVLVDGQPVNSCSYLAAQAQGRPVTTVEGL